jgi:hypothetical protein
MTEADLSQHAETLRLLVDAGKIEIDRVNGLLIFTDDPAARRHPRDARRESA